MTTPNATQETRKVTVFQAIRDPSNRDTFRVLMIATVCMLVIPLAVFFFVRHVLLPAFEIDSYVDAWSAGTAALAANLVIGFYVLYAFTEEDDVEEEQEAKKTN